MSGDPTCRALDEAGPAKNSPAALTASQLVSRFAHGEHICFGESTGSAELFTFIMSRSTGRRILQLLGWRLPFGKKHRGIIFRARNRMPDIRCFFPKGKRQPRTCNSNNQAAFIVVVFPISPTPTCPKSRCPRNAEHKFCESITGESVTRLIGAAVPSEFAPIRPRLKRSLCREVNLLLQQVTLCSVELFSILHSHSQFEIPRPTSSASADSQFWWKTPSYLPGPANNPHKLTKTAGPLARRRSRLGRLRTARRHGGRTSLPPMLVQSRRPPRRGEPRTEGGFCSLE